MSALWLGTRRSLMAITQSQRVADMFTQVTGHAVELVGVTTHGDVSKASLAQIGGTGVFVNGLRERIASGDIDFAVHSLKDLPTAPDNIKNAVEINVAFWLENIDRLTERFNKWATK